METLERPAADRAGALVRHRLRLAAPKVLLFLAYAAVAALVALPITVQRALETVSFDDRLGTLPVEVGLCHNGRSTLDTGFLGKIYWNVTGPLGLGAYARSTGPPEAGRTLASYVDPAFLQTNLAFIDNPASVADAYAARFTDDIVDRLVRGELLVAVVGGGILYLLKPHRRLRRGRRGRLVPGLVVVGAGLVLTSAVAALMWQQWPCAQPVGEEHAMPGEPRLSFSSPQTLEVAKQIQPFVQKNADRIEADETRYESRARATFTTALGLQHDALAPRPGETIVIAEADPQGSFVGERLRASLYADLFDVIGPDAVSLRTIAGDITSNGTVAESSFVDAEAEVAPTVPVAAVGGDHDSETTWKQVKSTRIKLVDLGTEEVGGLRVSGANDREHKSLFGGIITNDSGISEQQLGADLREKVDDRARIVVLHQPDAVAGYLGLDSLDAVRSLRGSLTQPYDDGIPDVPPGIVDYGHLHDLGGPWVLWNTDGGTVTWTVVDQLGTSGGVENHPTFNRFSTPFSVPLKPLTFRLQYVNVESGLQTGYATAQCDLEGQCTISDRVDVGIPGGQPAVVAGPGGGT